MADLETRVTVLEVRVSTLEGAHNKIESKLDDVKERLDKMGAILPGLLDTVDDINAKQDNLIERLADDAKRGSETGVKVKILWGAMVAVGASALTLVVKLLVG